MNQRDALRLALDALESYKQPIYSHAPIDAAIHAIRAALAEQPSAEPVAYRHLHEDGWEYYDAPTGADCDGCEPLYTAPPAPPQPSAEPVAPVLLRTFVGFTDQGGPMHKEEKLYEASALAAARDAGLEQAAMACEKQINDGLTAVMSNSERKFVIASLQDAARAIRALKEKK